MKGNMGIKLTRSFASLRMTEAVAQDDGDAKVHPDTSAIVYYCNSFRIW